MAIVYGPTRVANISWMTCLAALLFVSTALNCAAAPAIVLSHDESVRTGTLSSQLDLLEDKDGRLDIESVSRGPAATGFVAATPTTTNVGFSSSAWWVRFTLHNTSDEPRLVYLRQGYPLIDMLDLYQPVEGGGWRQHATGDRRPFGTRDVDARDFLFPITVPAQAERTYYVRYASQGPVDIHLAVLDPNEVTASESREYLSYGVYFGCVLMLLVWSGLVFIAVRDPAFVAYFAYVASFGIYMLVNTGFAFQYFWPDSPSWANTCLIVLLNLALITALQFSTTILRSRDYTPRLFRVAQGFQALGVIGIVLAPFVQYATLVKPVTFLILISVFFMISLGIISLLAGSRPARYYVIAWSAFLTGSVIFLLKNFGVVPHTFLSQHSWQVGALLEMILLSMTLSSRMNELKQQSRTDPLTLLGNRRLFDDRFPVEFAAALQEKRPISLLVLDIDNFKPYNDRHGHALGDEAIKLVGAALRRYSRKPALACRYGGDEFCMILPGTDSEAAATLAERLRANVEGALSDGTRITISVGHATLLADEFPSHDKLFDAADAALYSAKEAGRNCVSGFSGRRKDDAPRAVRQS
jgi:diguanylate cyclase (GGDEF)-like protein